MIISALGQVPRWRMHYHSCGGRNMSCSPYFSLLLRQISGRVKAVDLGCTRDVLGQREERGALQVHIWRSKSCFSQLKNPNQSALQLGHLAPRSAYTLGPWLFYFVTLDGRKHRTRVENTGSMDTKPSNY